jgi:hypothetical protein
MSKKYIVMERGFEYDDEYHREGEGGEPVKIFDTKVAAEQEASRLNNDTWKTHGYLYEYDYDEGYEQLIQGGLSIEDAVKKIGPKKIFYVVEVDSE